VSGLDAADLERYLLGLKPAATGRPDPVTIESLSPEKRALLLQRLHVRKAGAEKGAGGSGLGTGDAGASRPADGASRR
jgi:hypothetical protein